MIEEEYAQAKKEAAEIERLKIKQQEDWFDSDEFKEGKAAWLKSDQTDVPYAQTQFFTNARYLYRKRINGGGDGNDG